MKTHRSSNRVTAFAAIAAATMIASPSSSLLASSHMDAPLVTLDPAANTTDVYAFVTERAGSKFLQVALGVYPHEEPGIGPNKYNFDDNVLYQIILSTGNDLAAGEDTIAYQFQFNTSFKSDATILQSYVGVVDAVGDANQNLTQSYTVTKVQGGSSMTLGTGIVPPNNQGIATPKYNVGNDGNNVARDGVADPSQLDEYTAQAIATLSGGYRSFAGQREDGFYGDINAIFDLLQLKSGPRKSFDSQGGFNMHMIGLEIPVSELGGDQQVVGVYATTSRRALQVLGGSGGPMSSGNWVQVGRQGNPLFAEALIAIKDKDLYNRTKPTQDDALFRQYAETPELAALINAIVFNGQSVAPETNRTDLAGIFIPDMIKVDLSTSAARLAGGGASHGSTPDDAGFSRLSVFGGDALTSSVQPGFPGFPTGTIAGGWPNGRRFGDDVVDIAVTAIISDLRTNPLTIRSADGIDNSSSNDSVYNKVFPYAATPHNGRNYVHNPQNVPTTLLNLSARGWVGTGDNVLIGGLVLRGNTPQRVLVRTMGPSLAQFGVAGVLSDTVLDVYSGSTLILSNDDWKSTQQTEVENTGFAPMSDSESAVVLDLDPGLYTMILRGKGADSGVAIVETFVVD
ncbi:MAG TPA: DUF4331 domain-containing protein [Opitutaceae bacterium]